jgi:tetratricopeptide (TPR) repeat protein
MILTIIQTLSLLVPAVFAAQAPDPRIAEADQLFWQRDDTEKLKQAIAVAEKVTSTSAQNYEMLWRLAKYRYYLADKEPDKKRREKIFEAGVAAAKKAIAADPNKVQGHFWLGANSGELADLKGAFDSLGLVRTIRREFEAALAIDPNYARGTIHLALAQMDLQLPRLLGGNDRRGLARLEEGMKFGENNAELKLALADVYIKKNRRDEATRLLESIISEPDPLRSPAEMQELKAKAQQRLDKIR